MAKRTSAQIRAKSAMAKKVVAHHFGKMKYKLEYQPAGKTNFVFEVATAKKDYIIRISGIRTKLQDFMKEQWVVHHAREKGIPVPNILEVGNEIIPLPYMLQEKINGTEAKDHVLRTDILRELGGYAKLIHSIPTTGFGHTFEWSKNKLSMCKTWNEYLEKELNVTERLQFLQKHNLLPKKKIDKLNTLFRRISKWKLEPSLNHCDLRLKNVIVNDAGKIQAIIDWENSTSNIAPYWDFSIALHDLSIDGKQSFLEGYGLDFEEFERNSYSLTAFNLVNYVPSLERAINEKNKDKLEFYKLRINGELDLFSL